MEKGSPHEARDTVNDSIHCWGPIPLEYWKQQGRSRHGQQCLDTCLSECSMKAWSFGCGATCSRGNGFGQVLPEQAVLRFALGGQESRAGQKLIEIALGTVDEAVQMVKTY
uniref:Uncharacterized protein n=1 Tax=Magallana gigas TaxID=29159 RepID=A0A8W8P0Y5_MAGGI